MRISKVINSFELKKDYENIEEIVKQIELVKFAFGYFFRMMSKPTQMELIGTLEMFGGDFLDFSEYLRQFLNERDASEVVMNSNGVVDD